MNGMHRVTAWILFIMLAACGNAPAPDKPKGHLFEFRNMIAMQTTLDDARETDQFTSCEHFPNDNSDRCTFAKTQIAGVDVTNTVADFADGTFDYLDSEMPSYNYEPLRDALLNIYGKPCKTEAAVEAHRKEMGMIIRGREVQWCFDNGFLALMEGARHGGDDAGELEFISNREPTGEPEYNSSTL
jgi:hypothetical protein